MDEKKVTKSIGGVQGGEEGEGGEIQPAQSAVPGEVPDAPAPDGAELEWAGALVKKPPRPTSGA